MTNHRINVTVSAIIPTKDRPKDLAATVRNLLEQTTLPSQLIIVDQSLTREGTERVEQVFREQAEERIRDVQLSYICDPSIRGAANARNRAMEIASEGIWLFLDDDVCLEADFLEQIVRIYREHPDVGGVAGLITNYGRPPWGYRAWSFIFECGPFRDERQPIYWNASRLRGGCPIEVRKFTGCAMSFRSSAIADVRFDHRFPWALAEDIDLCARLGDLKLVIAPGARLKHLRSPVNRARDHWIRGHALTACYMYRRNWSRGAVNALCFHWLMIGEWLAACSSCLKQRSLEPLRALRMGIQQACQVTTPTS